MPENEQNLPKLLETVGAAACELPRAAIRQKAAHSHLEAQLCGLDAGLAVMETERGSWLCPPGRCIWIPSGMVHSLRSCGRIRGWMVLLGNQERVVGFSEPKVLALTPLLKEIVRCIAKWTCQPEVTEARQRLVQVLADEIAGASQVPLHLPVPQNAALRQAAAELATGLDSGGLPALARTVGVSERSLFRAFRQETGMSPGQWRRHARMLRALELLAEGRSVTQTALESGYEDTGAFIRAFRQVVGETPATYARQQRIGLEA